MLNQAYDFAQKKKMPLYVTMVENSGKDFNFGLSWTEKRKLLELAMKGKEFLVDKSTPEFLILPSGKVLKVDINQSFAFL